MHPAEKIKDWSHRSTQFYADVRGEMKKVSWPNRDEIVGTTGVVISAVFFFGLFFFVVDQVLGQVMQAVFSFFGG